jgi:hypothetical protein
MPLVVCKDGVRKPARNLAHLIVLNPAHKQPGRALNYNHPEGSRGKVVKGIVSGNATIASL